ncbi:lysophospholipase III, partial [Paragonimus westermani]
LRYDPKTHTTHDNEKYEVIFPGWGDTSTIEYLDLEKHKFMEYLHGLVTELRKDPYYVSNRTVRGAPYDFRRAPNENHVFVSRLTKLVEETYEVNDNRAVVLLGHSLGALYTLYFLQQKTDAWKRTYVKAYVPLGGPFGGSVRALLAATSGDNFGVFLRDPLVFRDLERSMPSIGLLLPNPRLWSSNEPLIFTPETNYSAHQYDKLFHDIAYSEGEVHIVLDTVYMNLICEATE